ncbi:nuclear transport factor 2 family protein [Rhizobium sp. BR 362]|uniref:nuclear transport factor 2 family protein n=1 Tax=Rhizobium sp. BR 362 TaxID=3040670 RepID=UPI002F42E99E
MDDRSRHLKQLEERLFDPAVRTSRPALEELLSAEFREIGSSGMLYTFGDIVDQLADGEPEGIARTLTGFELKMLSDTLALATYCATRRYPDGREVKTLRSSIWRLEADERWRMLFHQGTLTR